MESHLLLKMDIDKMLYALLGSNELVERWWTGPNHFFGLKTPYEVFEKNEAGRQAVLKYVENAAYGGGGS
jgi:hypothetical protein